MLLVLAAATVALSAQTPTEAEQEQARRESNHDGRRECHKYKRSACD
jgi:hypothetical protein